jgi:hypothetical protein
MTIVNYGKYRIKIIDDDKVKQKSSSMTDAIVREYGGEISGTVVLKAPKYDYLNQEREADDISAISTLPPDQQDTAFVLPPSAYEVIRAREIAQENRDRAAAEAIANSKKKHTKAKTKGKSNVKRSSKSKSNTKSNTKSSNNAKHRK